MTEPTCDFCERPWFGEPGKVCECRDEYPSGTEPLSPEFVPSHQAAEHMATKPRRNTEELIEEIEEILAWLRQCRLATLAPPPKRPCFLCRLCSWLGL